MRQEPLNQVIHFGVNVRRGRKHGLNIDRTTYANVSRNCSEPALHLYAIAKGYLTAEKAASTFVDPSTCREYSEEYASELAALALKNFDLNMMFIARIDPNRFQNEVDSLFSTFPALEPVDDLNQLRGKAGVYVMVLEKYLYANLTYSVQ